ncbi:MAG: VCBS repeat-containing protein [Kiritimatiellae bacterium]|nr:VCBS repeat-containing protein [Kiritimatiellia bacterium]
MNRYLSIIICVMMVGLWSAQPCEARQQKVFNDFDGDGKTDIAIYFPASGLWQVFLVGSLTITNVTTWSGPNYLPAPGDYDGDGKTDFMVFNSAIGGWYGKLSRTDTFVGGGFGPPGSWPVSADYDGDDSTDLAVYEPLTGIWWAASLTKGWAGGVQWGVLGDFRSWEDPQTYTVLPMPFDFNQDGTDDFAVYYRGWSMEDSGWYILYLTGASTYYNWGSSGSLPVPGNYQAARGNAPQGVCVYKITTAEWDIPYRYHFHVGTYGQTLPVPAGDYDGNGYDDNTVYNYVTGEWIIIYNTGGGDVDGRVMIGGGFGGSTAVPANIYSTIYKLARYSPQPW